MLIIFSSCAVPHPGPVCIKDSVQYGLVDGTFRSRWWNYYQRGQSYLEGECFQAAMSDLKTAITQNDQDQRMIRTYGLHFIDYFPHREMGLIYFLLNDLEQAQKELEKSISQEPSSKARHYLDQVRIKQLKSQVEQINTPTLLVDYPQDAPVWTANDQWIIKGTAKDTQYVASITINNQPYDLNGSEQEIAFSKAMAVSQGTYHIPIEIKNLMGGYLNRSIELRVDHQGPIIEIIAFEQISSKQYSIKGIASDHSEQVKLFVNQDEQRLLVGETAPFHIKYNLANNDEKSMVLTAIDRAGNKTKAILDFLTATKTFNPSYLASNEIAQDTVLLTKGKPPIQLTLSEWKKYNIVYTHKIYLEGCISTKSPLKSFKINNKAITTNQGRIVFFSIPIALNEGDNDIQVILENNTNDGLISQLRFTRVVPEIEQINNRLQLSMHTLKAAPELVEPRKLFQNQMVISFVEKNRFNVIAKFDQTETALEEKRPSSHVSLSGQYVDSRYGVEVAVRLIDNETTQILTAKDVFSEARDRKSILKMVDSLALRIHNEFPIVTGDIQQISNQNIQISLGKNKLKAQNRLIVFAPSIKNKAPEIIGHARITETGEQTSKIRIVHQKRPILLDDRVITQ